MSDSKPLTEETRQQMLVRRLRLHHRPGCDGARLIQEPWAGDIKITCTECGDFLVLFLRRGKAEAAEQQAAEKSPSRPGPVSRWRCREHPEQPVSWRGTGCAACAAARPAATI